MVNDVNWLFSWVLCPVVLWLSLVNILKNLAKKQFKMLTQEEEVKEHVTS